MNIPFSLLFAHWVADFLAQTDQMAIQKSKSLKWLTLHVGAYCAVMGIWALWVFWSFWLAGLFVSITFVTHWLTDFITSRINRELFPWKLLPGRTLYTTLGLTYSHLVQ